MIEKPMSDLVTIEVTKQMIGDGKVADCECCPIALAFNAILVEGVTSYVAASGYVLFMGADSGIRKLSVAEYRKHPVRLPTVAKRWMQAFDKNLGDGWLVGFRFAVDRDQFIPGILKEGV